jgi:hypothetical protein
MLCKQISGDAVAFAECDQQAGSTGQFEGMLRIDEVMRLMDVLPKA